MSPQLPMKILSISQEKVQTITNKINLKQLQAAMFDPSVSPEACNKTPIAQL